MPVFISPWNILGSTVDKYLNINKKASFLKKGDFLAETLSAVLISIAKILHLSILFLQRESAH